MTDARPNATPDIAERFLIRGRVGAERFAPWIDRHARRLGLRARIGALTPELVEVEVSGPPDLVDAMELGCSLGPIEVWVEQIDRESLTPGN